MTTDLRQKCTESHRHLCLCPLAAGIIALTLEANKNLTWRDMQHLVVQTSKPAHLNANDWTTNGVGRKVSHSYGYGLLDAGAMVALAQNWTTVDPSASASLTSTEPKDIGKRLEVRKTVTACLGNPATSRGWSMLRRGSPCPTIAAVTWPSTWSAPWAPDPPCWLPGRTTTRQTDLTTGPS